MLQKAIGICRTLILTLVILIAFGRCGGKAVYYVAEEKNGEELQGDSAAGPSEIHYFFDRTESMRGFTAKGDDSAFVNGIDSIWKAGKYVYPASTVSYYEYSELSSTNKISEKEVQDVKRASFYAPDPPRPLSKDREFVTPGTGQPFGALSTYIKARLDVNSLYVITTDLYEQELQGNVFTAFYSNAFEHGMSGALFAVESDFAGKVYGYSPTDPDAFITVPRDGKSLFFIFVIGGGKETAAYSGRLFKEFSDKGLTVKYWLFNNNFTDNPAPMVSGSPKVAQNQRRFKEYEEEMVNLRIPRQAGEIGLYQWEEADDRHSRMSARVQAFRLQTDIGSRYAVEIPVSAVQADFDFSVQLSVAYSSGDSGKTNPGSLSQFTPVEQPNFSAVVSLVQNKFALKIESGNNKKLKAGVYKVDYQINQKATVPDWISERSAGNVSDLRTSLMDGNPKVLFFKNVFEDITEKYNTIAGRSVCSGTIYFVKLK